MRARPTLLLMIVLTAACAPPPDYLFVDRYAQPVRVELRRSYGMIQKQYGPVPIAECAFFAKPDPKDPTSAYPHEIWRVVNTAPNGVTLVLWYGVLPPGFVQANPPAGRPPPLAAGERYSVECSGDAIGMAEFQMPATVTRKAPPLRKNEPTP